MKQILLFLTLVCIFKINASAQTEKSKANAASDCCCFDTTACFEKDNNYERQASKDIILDFRAKALGFPKNMKIKKGEFIRVKVVNYNPLLYKVNVDNRDSSVTQPNETGFLGMFLSPDKFSGAVAGLINTIGTPPKTVPPDKKITSAEWSAEYSDPKAPDTGSLVRPILLNYINDAEQKKSRIQKLRNDVETKLSEISKQYAYLQKLYLDCKELDYTEINKAATFFDTSLRRLLQESRDISQSIFKKAAQFKFDVADYMFFIISNPSYKIRYAFIDTFYKIATAELLVIDTSISVKKINEMHTAFLKLTQNSTCYTSLPIYIGNDIKVLTIGLKPVDEKSNLPSYQTSFSIPNYQTKIWGVSGGIFVSGLHNQLYTNKRKENDTTYNLIAEKQGKIQLGVNALAYMGWQINGKRPDYFGISFGAGMSLESKPKPRVLLGISYITGEKNRIGFSAGLTGGFVSRLSDAFSTTVNYAKPAENYQKDVMKMSGFLSINYSFLSK